MLMPATIETKVSLPAIVTFLTGAAGSALYAVVLAYGWLHPTPAEASALIGVGSFVLIAEQTILGYLAPHTPRPDLPPQPVAVATAAALPGGSAAPPSTPGPAVP